MPQNIQEWLEDLARRAAAERERSATPPAPAAPPSRGAARPYGAPTPYAGGGDDDGPDGWEFEQQRRNQAIMVEAERRRQAALREQQRLEQQRLEQQRSEQAERERAQTVAAEKAEKAVAPEEPVSFASDNRRRAEALFDWSAMRGNRDELRRAVVMAEVLGKCLAERPPEQ